MTAARMRLLGRTGGMTAFFLLVFSIAFYLAFPFGRIKEMIIYQAAQQNLDVEIGSAGPAFGIGMRLRDIVAKTQPADGSKPTRFQIDSARISPALFSLLFGDSATTATLETMGGRISIDWSGGKSSSSLKVKAEDLAMAQLPGVREAINLPLAGVLALDLDVATVNNHNSQAHGTVSWVCAACAIGDGKEKLKVAGNPMLAEGLTLPRIRLGDFVGRLTIEKGIGKFQGVQAKSPDGEVYVEGEIRLQDPFPQSYLDLYVRFKVSDALLKSSDKVQLMLQLAEGMGKRSDGFFGFRMMGPISALGAPQWSRSSPFTTAAAPSNVRGTPSRPFARPASSFTRPETPPRTPLPAEATAPAAAPGTPAPIPARPPTPPTGEVLVDPAKDPNANMPHFATESSSAAAPPAADPNLPKPTPPSAPSGPVPPAGPVPSTAPAVPAEGAIVGSPPQSGAPLPPAGSPPPVGSPPPAGSPPAAP